LLSSTTTVLYTSVRLILSYLFIYFEYCYYKEKPDWKILAENFLCKPAAKGFRRRVPLHLSPGGS
jgi:hypothetical protein